MTGRRLRMGDYSKVFPKYSTIITVLTLASIGVVSIVVWIVLLINYIMDHITWSGGGGG